MDSMQRIFLLPTASSPSAAFNQSNALSDVLVYAPVPVGLSVEDAKEMRATEAWIPTSPRGRRHHPRRHSSSSSTASRSHRHHKSCGSVSQALYKDDIFVFDLLSGDAKEDETN